MKVKMFFKLCWKSTPCLLQDMLFAFTRHHSPPQAQTSHYSQSSRDSSMLPSWPLSQSTCLGCAATPACSRGPSSTATCDGEVHYAWQNLASRMSALYWCLGIVKRSSSQFKAEWQLPLACLPFSQSSAHLQPAGHTAFPERRNNTKSSTPSAIRGFYPPRSRAHTPINTHRIHKGANAPVESDMLQTASALNKRTRTCCVEGSAGSFGLPSPWHASIYTIFTTIALLASSQTHMADKDCMLLLAHKPSTPHRAVPVIRLSAARAQLRSCDLYSVACMLDAARISWTTPSGALPCTAGHLGFSELTRKGHRITRHLGTYQQSSSA
eukprot:2950546-Amphidinium_carterae.2